MSALGAVDTATVGPAVSAVGAGVAAVGTRAVDVGDADAAMSSGDGVVGAGAVAAGGGLAGVGSVAGLPLERLEHEMLSLSGHLAAATCSFLVMVGEYDARGGWESWESYSCAHWLNWRCGVGMVAAREQVRVARALRELPVVTAAFSAGEVSYSKVRAITRVAHAGNETELVELARFATAAQLERAVSRLRRSLDPESLVENEAESQRLRSLRWRTELNGDLVVRVRIPAGVAADAFRSQLRAAVVTEAAEGEELEDLDARRLDAVLDVMSAGASVESSLAAQPEVIAHLGCELSSEALAAVLAGVPDASAGTSPEQSTAGRDPGSDEATGSATATATGSGSATVEWSLPPAALGPSGRTETTAVDGEGRRSMELERLTAVLRASVWPFRTSTGTQLSPRRARGLVNDAGVRAVFELINTATGETTSVDLGAHDRVPNRALRRAVMRRDRSCRFPGCTRRHRLHVHHIVWWEHGGLTVLENLLLLCPKHHHAIHDRHWTLTGTADDHTFRRPDGVIADPSAALLCGDTAELVAAHRRHGLDIAADGAGSLWTGDQIHWDCFDAAFANGPLAHDPNANTPDGSTSVAAAQPSPN